MALSSISPALAGLPALQPERAQARAPSGFDEAALAAGRRLQAQLPPQGGRAVQQVVPERTPLSGEQASKAIANAYQELTGKAPSEETLAILTSHWSLETGQGERMYNFNFAGLKGRSPEGMSAVLKTREGYGATEVHIRDGFRAYSSADKGALDYVGLLARRYSSALEAADAGEPASFVRELKAGGYFTGDEALYSKGIIRLANRAMEYGVDAVGGNPGVLASYPDVVAGRFSGRDLTPGAESHHAFSGSGTPEWAMTGASVDSMAEAVTRAALSIAAHPGGQGRDHRGRRS